MKDLEGVYRRKHANVFWRICREMKCLSHFLGRID